MYCILAPPSFLLGAHWALLGSPFRDVGGAVELLGHPLGPKWSQKHLDVGLTVSTSILAQVEIIRGSQRVSMGRFWEDVHQLFCATWYFGIFSVRKVCASWLQRRIAVAFLNVLDVVKAAPQARPKIT